MNNKDIIIQGQPGTGKTWLINQLKQLFKENKSICFSSTTWISGGLIDSPTYFRQLRLHADFKNKDDKIHCKTRKIIIIDEASMLSQENFNKLKQLFPKCVFILVGDWNQLQPVNGNTIKINNDRFDIFNLNVNYRIRDVQLNDILNAIKSGNKDLFNTLIANKINNKNLHMINRIGLYYTNGFETSKTFGKNEHINILKEKFCLDEHTIGAKLIAVAYRDDKTNNGKAWSPNKKWWKNNEIVEVIEDCQTFIKVKRYNESIQILYEDDLVWWDLANAITIHKSQGQTLDKVYIDLNSINHCQNIEDRTRLLYVACSRVRSLDDIIFNGSLDGNLLNLDQFSKVNVIETNSTELLKAFSEIAASLKSTPMLHILYNNNISVLLKESLNNKNRILKQNSLNYKSSHYMAQLDGLNVHSLINNTWDEIALRFGIKKNAIFKMKAKKHWTKEQTIQHYVNKIIKKMNAKIVNKEKNTNGVSKILSYLQDMCKFDNNDIATVLLKMNTLSDEALNRYYEKAV